MFSALPAKLAFHGGIPETKFVPRWAKMRIQRGRNRRFPMTEDFLAERPAHPLDDIYWASKRPDSPLLQYGAWPPMLQKTQRQGPAPYACAKQPSLIY
jgi:hypothetical protein